MVDRSRVRWAASDRHHVTTQERRFLDLEFEPLPQNQGLLQAHPDLDLVGILEEFHFGDGADADSIDEDVVASLQTFDSIEVRDQLHRLAGPQVGNVDRIEAEQC
jgi:hypothetical protein